MILVLNTVHHESEFWNSVCFRMSLFYLYTFLIQFLKLILKLHQHTFNSYFREINNKTIKSKERNNFPILCNLALLKKLLCKHFDPQKDKNCSLELWLSWHNIQLKINLIAGPSRQWLITTSYFTVFDFSFTKRVSAL